MDNLIRFIQTGTLPDTSYTFVPFGLGKIELISKK